MRVASIDIGTNTVRLLVCELMEGGAPRKVLLRRDINRLGGGFRREVGFIADDAASRTLSVLRCYSSILRRLGVRRVRAVATSVVREAANGPDFVRRVCRCCGLRVETISGEEEAKLTARGVLWSLGLSAPQVAIFDVGGGSTEVVGVVKGQVAEVVTLPLGVVDLAERFGIGVEPIAAGVLEELERVVRTELHKGAGAVRRLFDAPPVVVGTAGTATTLAAIDLGLERYDPEAVDGHVVAARFVAEVMRRMASLDAARRLAVPGMESGREDLIVPGCAIVLGVLGLFSCCRFVVSDGGLLEGLMHDLVFGAGEKNG